MSSARLVLVSLLILATIIIDLLVSFVYELPYEFGGQGDPNNMAGDFVAHGTALAPPLVPIILLMVFAFLAPSRRWWGTLSVVGLILLGVLFTVGQLGEIVRTWEFRGLWRGRHRGFTGGGHPLGGIDGYLRYPRTGRSAAG